MDLRCVIVAVHSNLISSRSAVSGTVSPPSDELTSVYCADVEDVNATEAAAPEQQQQLIVVKLWGGGLQVRPDHLNW